MLELIKILSFKYKQIKTVILFNRIIIIVTFVCVSIKNMNDE